MKILLAFDGAHFSEGAFEFATRLRQERFLLLAGVFIPPFAYSNVWSFATLAGDPLVVPVEEKYSDVMKKNIARFEAACRSYKINCSVHKKWSDFETPDLKKETRFADLAILGSESFYPRSSTGAPSQYVQDALYTAECPVLVVPEKFDFPESNILAYDGSASSVYAIKQFAYLFPELCKNKTLLVYAKSESDIMPDEALVEELAACHFPHLTMLKLDFDSKKYFSTWISEKKSAILVSGSFGRSFLSSVFKKSFVSDIIQEHSLPVFVTHK